MSFPVNHPHNDTNNGRGNNRDSEKIRRIHDSPIKTPILNTKKAAAQAKPI